MAVTQRKRAKLDLSLSGIADRFVRAGLEQIQLGVNEFVSKGLETFGYVKAKNIEAESAKLTAIEATSLSFGNAPQKRFSIEMYEGRLDPLPTPGSDAITYSFPKPVLGVIGWSQRNGGTSWVTMDNGSDGTEAPFFSRGSSDSQEVRVINNDTVNINEYRILVFLDER